MGIVRGSTAATPAETSCQCYTVTVLVTSGHEDPRFPAPLESPIPLRGLQARAHMTVSGQRIA